MRNSTFKNIEKNWNYWIWWFLIFCILIVCCCPSQEQSEHKVLLFFEKFSLAHFTRNNLWNKQSGILAHCFIAKSVALSPNEE